MQSTSKTTMERFQPYNLRTRATRVSYTPWFVDPHGQSEEAIKSVRIGRPGRGRGKKRAPQLGDRVCTSKQLEVSGPSLGRTEESSSDSRLSPSSPVPQTNSSGTGYRSVQGVIACALLEVCPNLRELADTIPELLACLNSAWASDYTKLDLPVGTTVEKLRKILQVDLDLFIKAVRNAVDEIISLLEYALRVLEKYNKTNQMDPDGSKDLMWSKAKTEEFEARSGSRIATLGKAMCFIRQEMIYLVQNVAGQLETVEDMSRATNTIKVSVHRTSRTIPSKNVAILRILSKQCDRAEKKLDYTVEVLHTFEGKLRQLLEGEEPSGDIKDIDADSIRPGVEKMKAIREEVEEESFVMNTLVKPPGPL
ncbi:hypothetical protein V5O48_004062 [Marasmius crinis-equi]|uniref:Uncharacterized protein n=1 Tax=Marasmius crinis-equi TaxID=585013 RepID=A0ABR3FR68_9AGAR